jgi:uncharacterized membrane protein
MAQFCSGCGAQMADGATVCAACGKSQVAAPAAAAPAAPGLDDNLAGALSYLAVPAIIFLVVEPYSRNKFVRFHAFQGLLLWVFNVVGHIVLTVTIIGVVLYPLLWLLVVVLGIIGAIKAFQGQKWKIPVIGPIAEKQADAI